MNQNAIDRGATSSTPEDLFADLFAQVFGPENTLMLAPQYPVKDIDDRNRFVDYALAPATRELHSKSTVPPGTFLKPFPS